MHFKNQWLYILNIEKLEMWKNTEGEEHSQRINMLGSDFRGRLGDRGQENACKGYMHLC